MSKFRKILLTFACLVVLATTGAAGASVGGKSNERFVVTRELNGLSVQVSLPGYPDAGVPTPVFVDVRDSATHEGSKGPVAMRFTLPGSSSDTLTLSPQPTIPGIFTGQYKFPSAGKYRIGVYIGAHNATASFDFDYIVALGVPQTPQPQGAGGGGGGPAGGKRVSSATVLIAFAAAVLVVWVIVTIVHVRVRVRVRLKKK
jgi:hypothetical protein